ncbi:TetR/AcrR family transcriptional regulator [Nocardia africana]|uniref:TetR/AcrR family transcriptional regulator n=1 Tax=Nocardia africana TaxID=134964 RepID=UPI001D13CF0A|nr:TetR/AcrR family transcriptional regulator [Nocardia africana]MCC3313614.1 TetR/AcrR family transcriptional regulator [Nocardia africana]
MESTRARRRDVVNAAKRELILSAAREVFAEQGLEASSVRAIAKVAGYTAGALYGHFPSKEHIYAALLDESLDRLGAATAAAATATSRADRFRATGLAFYDFYDADPRDLELGLYLFRNGIGPHGLSADLNSGLNAKLLASLAPITAAALDLGANAGRARELTAEVLAYATGVILLAHTRRLALFGGEPRAMMDHFLRTQVATLSD